MGKDVAAGHLQMLNEDAEWYMFDQAMEYLKVRDLSIMRYPTSAGPDMSAAITCATGRQKNILVWVPERSFINSSRFINEPYLKQYVDTLLTNEQWPVKELERMSERELMIDALILGLRLCAGIDLDQFKQRFGVDITSEYKKIIAYYRGRGLLNIANGHLKFTKAGYFLSNQVLCQFMA